MLMPLMKLDNDECLATQQRHNLEGQNRRSNVRQLIIYNRSENTKRASKKLPCGDSNPGFLSESQVC